MVQNPLIAYKSELAFQSIQHTEKHEQNLKISIYRQQNSRTDTGMKICIFRYYKIESIYLHVSETHIL
jgi:hypothetical protein